jgi:hypothetical protein
MVGTFDLLVLTSLDLRSSVFYFIYLFRKTSYFNEEVNCTEPFPSVSFPCPDYTFISEGKLVGLDDVITDGLLQIREHAVEDGEVEAAEVHLRQDRALKEDDVPRLQNLRKILKLYRL